MTNREQDVLSLINDNPLISQKELAQRLGIERSSVAVHIANLIRKGVIRGRGYVVADTNRMAVLGAANVDICGSSQRLIVGESNIGTVRVSPGGVGRNIAEVLARLDMPVALFSAVGDDSNGRLIMETCRALAIDTSRVWVDARLPTSVYLSILDQTGDMQLAVNDMAVTACIDTAYIAKHQNCLKTASVVVVEANLSTEVLQKVSTLATGLLLADPVSVAKAGRLRSCLGSLTGIKPNRSEAELLSGIGIVNRSDAIRAIRILHDRGVRQVALSLGSEGVLTSDGSHVFALSIARTAGRQNAVSNTTGCGDVFLAVWAAGLFEKRDFRDCMVQAMAAAHCNALSAATIHEGLNRDLIDSMRKDVVLDELSD